MYCQFRKYLGKMSKSMNKLMLVKVGSEEYPPSIEDLEKWKDIFEKAKSDPDLMVKIQTSKEISIEEIDFTKNSDYITLIKINGNNGWAPSKQDLEAWRD